MRGRCPISLGRRKGWLLVGREWGQARGHQFYDNEPLNIDRKLDLRQSTESNYSYF